MIQYVETGKIALYKMVAWKNGALTLVSFMVGLPLSTYVEELTRGVELRKIILPFIVLIVGLIFYFAFTIVDMFTGLWKAKYLNSIAKKPQKRYIKSYKLYRTLWKFLGISLLSFMMMFLCLFTAVINMENTYYITLWILVSIPILASGFEFHSIGENIEQRTGSKPELFDFFDKLMTIIQRGILFRTKRAFDKASEGEDKELDQILAERKTDKNNEEGR